MKKIFAIACAMLLTAGAFAQENYQRIQVSYVSHKLSNFDMGDKSLNPKGFNVAGLMGFAVSDVQPVYVETGLGLTWAHSAVDYNEALTGVKLGEMKFSYMNVAIPINGVYKYAFNDKVAFSAHAGLNFKVNFMAKYHLNPEGGQKYSASWLSKKDMGSRDNRANIFQLGGQVGCGFNLGFLYIGYQFQPDFMKFIEAADEKHRWNTQYITLGYTL